MGFVKINIFMKDKNHAKRETFYKLKKWVIILPRHSVLLIACTKCVFLNTERVISATDCYNSQ